MKLSEQSKLNRYSVGVLSGLLVVFIITSIIIDANIYGATQTVWDQYLHFFDSPISQAAVLASLKGGAIGVLPVFYLFLNKKMMKAVKGLIGVVAFIGLIVVWGILS